MSKLKMSPTIVGLASICLLVPITQEVKADNFNLATNQLNSSQIAQRMPRLRFKLPSRGIPGARIGGATRTAGKFVTAIIPQEKLALTASGSPTIFVYIPNNEYSSANLTITDQEGNQLYSSDFAPPQTAGILRIKLPETVNLETDKTYRWQVKLNSETTNPLTDLKLKADGWMEKVSLPEDNNDLTEEQTWTNLNTLAEAGIWHDTLEQLAILRLENPEDREIEAEWTELLKSVGLDSFAHSNILPDVIEIQ